MPRKKVETAETRHVGPVSNHAAPVIGVSEPYMVAVTLHGTVDLLFHRWNVENIAAQASAAKGSAAKKTDNIEAYVYRNKAGKICIPGDYLKGAIVAAAKFRQDPRSPRKSAQDLYKAGVSLLTPLASLGLVKWDFEDQRRVTVQRSGITRTRPGIREGWEATFELMILLPEYIPQTDLHGVLTNAGRLVGLGDHRPSYGRFQVQKFEVITLIS